jgi:hypothetical protein
MTNPMIKRIAVEPLCSWITPGHGFKSVYDYKRCMAQLPSGNAEWKRVRIVPNASSPQWAPPEILYYSRDSLEVLRNIVGDTWMAKHMKWAPEQFRNAKGECLYSEL